MYLILSQHHGSKVEIGGDFNAIREKHELNAAALKTKGERIGDFNAYLHTYTKTQDMIILVKNNEEKALEVTLDFGDDEDRDGVLTNFQAVDDKSFNSTHTLIVPPNGEEFKHFEAISSKDTCSAKFRF